MIEGFRTIVSHTNAQIAQLNEPQDRLCQKNSEMLNRSHGTNSTILWCSLKQTGFLIIIQGVKTRASTKGRNLASVPVRRFL